MTKDDALKARLTFALSGTALADEYEILGVIASGGWGTVYKARQLAFDRLVALKVLNRAMLADSGAIARFRREAQSAGQIKNKHIAAVYDQGVLSNGLPYLVMQYFEGQDFSKYLRKRVTLTAEEAIPIFIQLCEALSVVHQHDIIHRDIKPSNILLCKDDDGSVEAKIIDFGLVGMLRTQVNDWTKITQTGFTLGTAAYMSPEQCMGQPVGAWSDVYSLGCTLYECLSGVQPFASDNWLVSMRMHLQSEVPPLKVQAQDPKVAEQLRTIVMCALERHPQHRFQSAEEFGDELRRCLSGSSRIKARQVEKRRVPQAKAPQVEPKLAKQENVQQVETKPAPRRFNFRPIVARIDDYCARMLMSQVKTFNWIGATLYRMNNALNRVEVSTQELVVLVLLSLVVSWIGLRFGMVALMQSYSNSY